MKTKNGKLELTTLQFPLENFSFKHVICACVCVCTGATKMHKFVCFPEESAAKQEYFEKKI
jgi:hypothetical protein